MARQPIRGRLLSSGPQMLIVLTASSIEDVTPRAACLNQNAGISKLARISQEVTERFAGRHYDRKFLEWRGGSHDLPSRLLAGILLIVLPTVMVGGVSILSLVIGDPTYMENPLRQDLWRAGHAHAGVWLILALVALRYVDEANLSNVMKWLVRGSIPSAAILVPAAFFLSVLSPDATVPNALIYLAYVGAVVLAAGVLVLGIGLVRPQAQAS